MKFGLFYEHQLPQPWAPGDEERLFAEILDQIELADRLGYDNLWIAEHHFLPEYSHSSAPEMILAAASQRTSQIRLGHGIVQATTNHPARIAERIATLDVLSGGRAELGFGEGQGLMELEPFGVTMEEKRERFEDTVRAAVPMLYTDRRAYEGTHHQLPPRTVVPKPVQSPHPPLWVACTKTKTIRDAAAWGLGVLGFSFASPERAELWVGAYYNQFLKRPNRLGDYTPNPNIAVSTYMMCAPTDELARERFATASFFEYVLSQYSRSLLTSSSESLWDRYQAWLQTDNGQKELREPKGLVGSPERLRSMVRDLESTHVDQIVMVVQAGRTRHEDICASLELFASEVMSYHHDQSAHDAWKQAVLAGDIELRDPVDEELSVDGERIPGPPRGG